MNAVEIHPAGAKIDCPLSLSANESNIFFQAVNPLKLNIVSAGN